MLNKGEKKEDFLNGVTRTPLTEKLMREDHSK